MASVAEQTTTETKTATCRVRFGDPAFGEVLDFLWEEAYLLNGDRQQEWLDLMADDVLYTAPIRKTVHRSDGPGIDTRGGSYHDDRAALELRVRRNVVIESAYDRDPPPRIRRYVTNIVVHRTDIDNEFQVNSSVLLLRNQFQETHYDFVSAERQDLIRRTDDGMKLFRRTVLFDMTTLGGAYPNVLF